MAELSPEAHARLVWALMVILYSVFALRCWALRKVKDNYSFRSPRGISTMCIIATILVTSALAGMVTWSLVGPYQYAVDDVLGIQGRPKNETNPITASPYLHPSSVPSSIAIATQTAMETAQPTGELVLAETTSVASTGGAPPTPIFSADAPNKTEKPDLGPQFVDAPPPGASVIDLDISAMSPEQLAAMGITLPGRKLVKKELVGRLAERSSMGVQKRDVISQAEADARARVIMATGKIPDDTEISIGGPDSSPVSQEELDKIMNGAEADGVTPAGTDSNPETPGTGGLTRAEADKIAKDLAAGLAPPSGVKITADPEGKENIDLSKLKNGDLQVDFFAYKDDSVRRKFETAFKVNFASMAIFYTAIWLAKASFLVFYFEFSSSLSQRTRRLLYASSVAMVATYGFTMLVHLMWCLPIEENWNLQAVVQIRTCRSEIAPSIIAAVINVLTDLLLACTFFAIIRSIQSNRNDWRAASLILFTGCLTILVAIVRLACLCALMVDQNKALNDNANTAENGTLEIHRAIRESVIGYPEVEAILAAMATCLPALRALFRQSTGRSLFGSTRGGTQMTAPPTYRSQLGTQNGSAVNMSEKDLEAGAVSGFKFQ